MAFDPCGTRRLEGEEILERLARYLGVSKIELKIALEVVIKTNVNKL